MRTVVPILLALACACTSSKSPGEDPGEIGPRRAPSAPETVAVDRWIAAPGDPATTARIQQTLDLGAFEPPGPGDTYLGVTWEAIPPAEGGGVAVPDGQLTQVFAGITAGPHDRFFARADRVQTVGTVPGGRGAMASLQPGDPYGSGRSRVPLRTTEGENLVVAVCRPGCSIELFRTTSEVAFDTADVTSPDLVAGARDPQWLGLPLLALEEHALRDVSARVLESDLLLGTERVHPSLVPGAASQLTFELTPRDTWPAGVASVPVKLQVTSPDLAFGYEQELEVPVAAPGALHRRTRISGVDGSVQYHAVLPPSGEVAGAGLILSLHGAAVEATGQAASYSPKDWAFVIAPTNRRPYGFDWEEWGRLDALEALADALQVLPVDPGRVHLTGHSMGGHGTWHVGVHFSPRFGVIAPSAGWISFDTYGGAPAVPPAIEIARAASRTERYVENLRGHGVFVIHGTADDNVPLDQALRMLDILEPFLGDQLLHHFQPGAGHWWDADPEEPGADCVDWEPMIALMKETSFDPVRLAFDHRVVSPWVNPTHSFVTVRSELDPAQDVVLHVEPGGEGEVVVETGNARSLVLDGSLLASRGIHTAIVDGEAHRVDGAPIPVGPQDGKNERVHGPFNQVFHRPFCFVWPDGSVRYRELAAFFASTWNVIGNGRSCGVPLSRVTDELAAANNLVWMGVPMDRVRGVSAVPIAWDDQSITIAGSPVGPGLLQFVFPSGDRLHAVITATAGSERWLSSLVPFSSRSGMPDFAVIGSLAGGLTYEALGYFTPDWKGIDLRNSSY